MAVILCAATEAEIQPTLDWLRRQKKPYPVDVIITGVGLLAAAYHITKTCLSKPQVIVQAGVAGCFDEAVPLGTTAVILRETIGDLGVLQNNTFTPAFSMGLLKANEHPWTGGQLGNRNTELVHLPHLVLADGVTVNEISTNSDRISYYKNGLGATAESMEGAALHYVALMENIPFLQLRSFCNYVGERDKTNWRMESAIANLNAVLQEVLPKIMHP